MEQSLLLAITENDSEPLANLLTTATAELDKTNKSDETPADMAERKGDSEILTALEDHAIEVQDETINGDLILRESEQESEQEISDDLLKLLLKYHIQKSDMDAANDHIKEIDRNFNGIEAENWKRAIESNSSRTSFRFFISGSMNTVRDLLLCLVMDRNRIKLSENIIEVDEAVRTVQFSTQANYGLSSSEIENSQQPLLIPREHSSDLKKIRQKNRCCSSIGGLSAIPFECEITQRRVYFLSAFHATADETFEGIWSLLWLSLLLQGTAYFYQYPEERYINQTIVQVLGLRAPLIQRDEYQTLLSGALINSPILALMLIASASLGLLSAFRASRNNQALDNSEMQKLTSVLKGYKPEFKVDTLGWVFIALLPDFPLCQCCSLLSSLLPQLTIKEALEKIQRHILWDGRLSAKDRLKLFHALYRFAHHRTQLTQMKALAVLAALAISIDTLTFPILQEEGVDDDNIKAYLFIKAHSLQALDFLANHYHLPGVPKSLFGPFFRYIYANYLMWYIGYPQRRLVQPLFYFYRMIKLYFMFQLYSALVEAIPFRGKFHFSVCSLLPDFIAPFHFYPKDCFEEYLITPKTFEQLIKGIELLPKFKEWYVNSIKVDLSLQKKLIQMKELPNMLNALAKSMTDNHVKMSEFILRNNQLSLEDMKAIGHFLKEINKDYQNNLPLDLSQNIIEKGGIIALIETASDPTANKTYLSGSRLILSNVPLSEIDMAALANIVATLNEIHLNNCNISVENCLLLAEKIIQRGSSFSLNSVNLADNLIQSDCVEIMAKYPLHNLNLGGNNRIGDQGIEAVAKSFNKTSSVLRSGEYFLSGHHVNDESLLQLMSALPTTGLLKFHYSDYHANGTRNFSLILPALVEMLNKTSLNYFGWNSPGGIGLGDEGIQFLSDTLKNTTSGINWDLSDNQIGPEGMEALNEILVFNRNELILRNNNIESGITSIAKAIATEMGKLERFYLSLDLANNQITVNNTRNFTPLIQQAHNPLANYWKISRLSFANNPIGDQGVIEVMKLVNMRYDILNFGAGLLNLSQINMSHIGAKAIVETLRSTNRHRLWIEIWVPDYLLRGREIDTLDLSHNLIDEESALALCDAFARNKRNSDASIILTGNPINQTIIENCGHLISEGHFLRAHSPYVLMYRFYRGFYDVVSQRLFNADKTLVVQSQNETTTEIALVESDHGINDFDTMDETAMICIEVEEASTSLLYTSLFTICETFLRAVHQSAWLTAIPVFAEEVLHRMGGYTREEIARFHQELQMLLMVSLAHSPHSLAASYLARWLAHQLTDSPQVIATVGTGAALATSVFENVLNTPASFRWIALQTGVALMGSVLGSLAVQQIPKVGQWGINQFNRAKDYIGSRVSFWSYPVDEGSSMVTDATLPILPNGLSTRSYC